MAAEVALTGRENGANLPPLGPSPIVILVRPQLADNVGAAARAMANGGLYRLRLVAPRDGWPQPHAWRTASGADRILDELTLHPTVADAVADLNRVLATCPRPRYVTKPVLTARAAAADLRAAIGAGQQAGILFGPERAGLDNDDMAQADTLVRYPLNPAFSSLNLAQAVMVMAYEWWTAADATPGRAMQSHGAQPATKAQLAGLMDHLVDELDASAFLRNPAKRPGMVHNLYHLFQRGEITDQEVRTLRGVVAELSRGRMRRGRVGSESETAGELTGEQPADQSGGRAADADEHEADRLLVEHQLGTQSEHQAADEPARNAGRDAQPEDVAAIDHVGRATDA